MNRSSHGSSDRGQATVEFALLMPFFAALVACILGVTAVCLDILRTDDLARTAARLASVSATPQDTARGWVLARSAHSAVVVRLDESTVRVTISRRLAVRIPLLDDVVVTLPYSSTALMAVEPPPARSTDSTNVAP